ncbi:hypothetical protein [Leptolyngbya sp. FACHB-17]|uniref:hypothetical protein n=1 Tax=unclassified Leptolyngbya TaxID=2650499 RepID=UPI0016807A8E|nr:hypothetical protein [Leptolyngbya sp. FACHB-17]MBD2081263.1 hypothetical protein [Leptolyngbya sp. FACHB-17]
MPLIKSELTGLENWRDGLMFARFDQVQFEIHGLRLETQRMLDADLNQEPPDEDTGN